MLRFQDLYVSFNGGKDATVVLFLTYFALQQYLCANVRSKFQNSSIKCIYFEEPRPF